jgi:ectoine hydroxylase-related dioxygenase (phytanoyl-CoA dioxygenase family)
MEEVNLNPVTDAADQIKVNGYVVLPDLLPLALIENLLNAFDKLLAEHILQEPSNRGANRYQMYLPFESPFADTRIYANRAVMPIVEQVLGPDPLLCYFASDTPLPGSGYQNVHSDTRLLFPETQLSLPCYGLVLNIPLVDVTEENGPMEIWPGGTHLWPGIGSIASLAEKMPSGPLLMDAGSVVLRDLRMWHRGTPNRSNRSRPNLALVYTRPWYRFEQRPPVISAQVWNNLLPEAQKLLRAAIVDPSIEALEEEQAEPTGSIWANETPHIQEDPKPSEVNRLVQEYITSPDSEKPIKKKQLTEIPRGATLARLKAVIAETRSFHTYASVTHLLAEWKDDESVNILTHEAMNQEEFMLVAVNALMRCNHPKTISQLIDLLVHGNNSLKRTAVAFALSKVGTIEAIEPLARIASNRNDLIYNDASLALREMGNPADLARLVLTDSRLNLPDRARIIDVLARSTRFNARRFLEREALRGEGAAREMAGKLIGLMRDKEELLRSSTEDESEMLLHPAHVTGETLLRKAESPEGI